eukprot:4949099-Pleurochrysis_carterae.AAC.1
MQRCLLRCNLLLAVFARLQPRRNAPDLLSMGKRMPRLCSHAHTSVSWLLLTYLALALAANGFARYATK